MMGGEALVHQPASLSERGGSPLPSGAVPPGTRPTVAVVAGPGHPSDAVLVAVRHGGGVAQFVRAIRQTAPGQGPQWFKAALPPVEAGRQLDYRVELSRAGQCLAT